MMLPGSKHAVTASMQVFRLCFLVELLQELAIG